MKHNDQTIFVLAIVALVAMVAVVALLVESQEPTHDRVLYPTAAQEFQESEHPGDPPDENLIGYANPWID